MLGIPRLSIDRFRLGAKLCIRQTNLPPVRVLRCLSRVPGLRFSVVVSVGYPLPVRRTLPVPVYSAAIGASMVNGLLPWLATRLWRVGTGTR